MIDILQSLGQLKAPVCTYQIRNQMDLAPVRQVLACKQHVEKG